MSRIHDALKKLSPTEDPLPGTGDLRSAEIRRLLDVSPTSVADVASPMRSSSLLDELSETNWTFHNEGILDFDGGELHSTTEEFRSLRARMYQLREKQVLKSILVCSALPGEGKSFVAANFARVLALQSGCRVLLIDGDLRRRRLHGCFGTKASPGLSEYLLNQVEEFEILQRGKAGNLFLIPAGREVAGPAELIANGRFRDLLSALGSMFDWIIVDTPSANVVSDACLLSNSCDGVLMVVRAKSTHMDVVRKALERFPEQALLGVVLNEIRDAKNRRLSANSKIV